MSNLDNFIEVELSSKEFVKSILGFLNNTHIVEGEYEGNLYILKKIDVDSVVIFQEEEYDSGIGIANFELFEIADLNRLLKKKIKCM